MKFYCTNCILKFDWGEVASAFWRRYPNPYSRHVLSEDIITRSLEDGKLITKKLITKTNRLPRWGERFVSSKVACIVEESITDPERKTLTTYTRNITFTRLMVVEEKCIYSVHPTNREWTLCEKQSWISSGVFGFARAIERFGVERYKKNAAMAVKGLQFVIEKLFVPEKPPLPIPIPVPHSNMMT